MNYFSILQEIIVMFIVIGAGYLSAKLGVIKDNASDVISNILMKITFPALIIASMHEEYSAELFTNSIAIIVISIVVHLLFIFMAFLWKKWYQLPHEQLAILRFVIIFGNIVFMGFPLVNAVYGKLGIFYAASFNMISIFLLFSYGVLLLSGRGGLNNLKTLMNPGLVAVVVGYILFLTPLELPYVLLRPLQWVGDITIPLALLLVGNSLASIPIRDLFVEKQLWYVSLVRLLIIPVLIMTVLKILNVNPYLIGISVILSATPAPLLTGVFARTYGCDGYLGDKTIVLTQLLSIITIPLLILLLEL